ncbi:MAG TPA: YceI family protein [Bryobacteraceae bacterium]|nr:YceI family protein [Bryobacteraceae bacterium]
MTFLCASSALALATVAFAQPKTYEIQPAEGSRFELLVYKTGLMKGKTHSFLFPHYKATLTYDAQAPERSQVRLSIETAPVQLTDTWLSAKDFQKVQDFARKDMLNAERYPSMTFDSLSVSAAAAGEFEVKGTLSIRNVGKPATIRVKIEPRSDGTLRFTGESKIKLTDYGLKPPSAALGTIGTKDEMDVKFVLIGLPSKTS